MPLEAYYDFETPASTDSCLDPEDKKMFAVLYAIIFAFHLQYHLDGVLIKRSFTHTLEQLTDVNYLTRDQLLFANPKTILQLKDSTVNVSWHASKKAVSEIFSTELKFSADCLLNWFNKKLR